SVAAALTLATIGLSADHDDPPGLEVSAAVHYDLSLRLGDITPIPPGGGPARKHPIGEIPDVPGTSDNPDPVIQSSTAAAAPASAIGFEGIGVSTYRVTVAPSDAN